MNLIKKLIPISIIYLATSCSDINSPLNNFVKSNVAQKGAGNAYGLSMLWCNSSDYSEIGIYSLECTNFSVWRQKNVYFSYYYDYI